MTAVALITTVFVRSVDVTRADWQTTFVTSVVNLRELETLNEETFCSYVSHQEHRDRNLDQKEFDFE